MAKKTSAKSKRKGSFTTPKGMRDISREEFFAYQGFFEKAAEIALYYGFKPIETPILEKEEVFKSGVGTDTDIVGKEMYTLKTKGGDRLALRPEGTAGIMRAYLEHGMHTLPQPVMLYYHGPFFRHEKPQRGRTREFFQFGFETIGAEQPIIDALTIKLTHLILEEVGIKNLMVLLNSIGDSHCRPNYIRELTAYYRKHINKSCANCRMRLKKNPLRLLDCKEAVCKELAEKAPDIMGFLCEGCRRHFTEVLEYLEIMKIPYSLKHTLVRGIDYYTRTVFEVVSEGEIISKPEENKPVETSTEPEIKKSEEVVSQKTADERQLLSLGGGGRYDQLAKALGSRRDIPAVGSAIGADRVISAPGFSSPRPRIVKKPKIYFIQIGTGAKLKSFTVIETLRGARIPLMHSINKDKLSIQLGIAEKIGIPYIIILGQKEANEDAVIVRNMKTRSQETVPMKKLADYLKKRV
ncbi:MAG: histidine--tRNA ligase [Parcubacteria group bacterium]|nr:histidine--tRNA ligase [Parcubacteria group bacterium]